MYKDCWGRLLNCVFFPVLLDCFLKRVSPECSLFFPVLPCVFMSTVESSITSATTVIIYWIFGAKMIFLTIKTFFFFVAVFCFRHLMLISLKSNVHLFFSTCLWSDFEYNFSIATPNALWFLSILTSFCLPSSKLSLWTVAQCLVTKVVTFLYKI